MIFRDRGTFGRPLKPNSGVFDLIRTSGDFDHRFLGLNMLARVQCSTVHSQCKEGLSIRQRVLALCVEMSFTPDVESPQTQMKEKRLQRHRTLYLQVHTCTTAVILVARSLTLAVQNCTGDPVDDNHSRPSLLLLVCNVHVQIIALSQVIVWGGALFKRHD